MALFRSIRPQDINRFTKDIEYDSITANELVVGEVPIAQLIGLIIPSTLSEAQMVLQDSRYALCDGRSCIGSTYNALTGRSTVPDLRGQFLRGAGLGRSVDTYQGDSTKTAGISFSLGDAGTHFHAGSAQTAGSHVHTLSVTQPATGGAQLYAPAFLAPNGANSTVSTDPAGDHTHNISVDSSGLHTHPSSILGGDAETRPTNYGVNFYIKVN